jgi:hypothetical protein
MVKQNYLDIYPSSGIANMLNAEIVDDEPTIARLVADVNQYIQTAEEENVKFLHSRGKQQITSTDTFRFFRSQERNQNTPLILQYMLAFLTKIPLKEEIDETVVNPFRQLKEFALFHASLLKEADVCTAILREHERLGLLTETNTWYYRGQVNKNYKQVVEALESAKEPVIEDYCKLFDALQRLSLFWFSVRSENIKRVRKSDIYLYKLSLILMNRNCFSGRD